MIMVIAFMALSIPMITGALSLSGTLSSDSTVKTEILKRQYSALGGDQFGGYLAPIHRTGACERPAEETKGCASGSGIMVLKQKTDQKQGAPNRCYHATNPTASTSPSTTGQSRLNQGAP